MDKVKASEVKAFYTPKRPVVETQCPTCPFRPDGGLFKGGTGNKRELAKTVQSVEMGMEFSCHKTVYDPPVQKPADLFTAKQTPQTQWRACAGAVAHKRKCEVSKRLEMLRAQGRLIENE